MRFYFGQVLKDNRTGICGIIDTVDFYKGTVEVIDNTGVHFEFKMEDAEDITPEIDKPKSLRNPC